MIYYMLYQVSPGNVGFVVLTYIVLIGLAVPSSDIEETLVVKLVYVVNGVWCIWCIWCMVYMVYGVYGVCSMLYDYT